MEVAEAIAAAERILPGEAAPENTEDPRWQAIIHIADFIESDPDECFAFAVRWGSHPDADLRSAIATCLLEHLLENRFEEVVSQVEKLAQENPLFADTVCQCWPFPQSEKSERAERFRRVVSVLRKQ